MLGVLALTGAIAGCWDAVVALATLRYEAVADQETQVRDAPSKPGKCVHDQGTGRVDRAKLVGKFITVTASQIGFEVDRSNSGDEIVPIPGNVALRVDRVVGMGCPQRELDPG